MGLKPGYKLTEVGVIPEDWETQPLGNITTLMTNGFVGTATSHYVGNENGVLYIQGYNVEENSFNFHGIKFVTEEFHRLHMKSCLRSNDLLTVQTGDVGLTTIVPESLAGANCHALIISRLDQKRVIPLYISYYLNSDSGRSRLKLIEIGTTMKHLNIGDMLGFIVPLPINIDEQRVIANALSDVDALLDGLDRLIAKKRDLKQAVMQQLLTGETRLPGFKGLWVLVRAGDIGQFRSGNGFPTRFQGGNSGEYPFFKVSDMNNDGNEIFMVTANNYIHESIRKQIGSIIFPAQTIIFAKVGAAIFLERKKILKVPSCIDNNMAGFIIDATRVDVCFMHYILLRKNLGDLVSTTALPSLGGKVLAAIEFYLPPLAEQNAIVTILSDIDAEIATLEQRRKKTKDIKQAMMQELLTGKTRLISPGGSND